MGDLSTNLSLYEVIPKREYDLVKAGKVPVFNLIDMRMVMADQKFINRYGTTIINNWHDGGSNQFCGYRPWDCAEGARYSLHRMGKATDKHPVKVTVQEVHADLIKYPDLFYAMGYTIAESPAMTPSWVHTAIADTGQLKLLMVVP